MKDNKRYAVKRPSGEFCTEELISKSGGNVFRLVRMAAVRALELSLGKPALIDNVSTDKVATIALEEIAQGKIVYVEKKKSRKKEEEEEPELETAAAGLN